MKELIPVSSRTMNGNQIKTVNARELHEFLGPKTQFKDWISRRIEEYNFVEDKDFCSFLSESTGGRPSKEIHISLEMAKELSMVERNERGKQARQYFIECERIARQPVDPGHLLNDPRAMRGLLLGYTEKVLALQEEVAALEPKACALDRISDADGCMCITNAAKHLQVRPGQLFSWLQENRWVYRRAGGKGLVAYQDRIQSGLLTHKITTVTDIHTGMEKITEQVLVTAKGLARLAVVFGSMSLPAPATDDGARLTVQPAGRA